MSRALLVPTTAEYRILRHALKEELAASWGGEGPCKYRLVKCPDFTAILGRSACRLDEFTRWVVGSGSMYAVEFTVLGRVFTRLDEFQAHELTAILRAEGVFSEPSDPNHDASHVFARQCSDDADECAEVES